jgi:hypothetical protein
MAAWLEEYKSDLLLEQYIRRAAQQWTEAGCPGEELMRGSRARHAKEMLDLGHLSLTAGEAEFIGRSWKQETEEERVKSQLVSYYSVRDAATREFVAPTVRKRIADLEERAREIDRDERKARASGWGMAEALRAECNTLASLIGEGGKWHPLPPTKITEEKEAAYNRSFYGEWWRFPCCGYDMLAEQSEPSQLQSHGCRDVPEPP